MPTLSKTPSVGTFTEAWSRKFAEVVKEAAGKDGRLSASEAAKIANRTDDGRVFADNAVNYLKATGQKSVSADKLIDSGRAYAFAVATKAAGPDGRLSAADHAKLPKDLFEDIRALQKPSTPAPSASLGATLTQLTTGMLNNSESESPVIPIYGPNIGTAPITKELVTAHVEALFAQHKDAMAGGERYVDSDALSAQPFTTGNAADFISRRTQVYDVGDPQAEAYAAKWKALGTAIGQNVRDLTLFRFGTVEATYVLVGRTASGELAGFMTGAIET